MTRQITSWTALGLAVMLTAGLTACNNADQRPPKLDSEDAKVAYSIGYMTGKQMLPQIPKLDSNSYTAGFRAAYAGQPSLLNEEQMKQVLMAFEERMRAEAATRQQKNAADNSSKGAAYLAENAKKPGVKTTASGLQYEVLSEGQGAHPKATDIVKVHYEGKLLDGTVFDSSLKRNEPATFRLDQVVPGWTEGLQLMSVGSKYRFTIPARLGYGEQGTGPIPPNAVLIFEVQLLEIMPPQS